MPDDTAATFETCIANQVGIIRSNLEQVLDRNPDLPPVVRQRLTAIVGKCAPLASSEHLERLRDAYDASGVRDSNPRRPA